MSNRTNGFIVISRKINEWKYHDYPNMFALWIDLLLKANWKPAYFKGVLVPRGSFITSMRNLAQDNNLSVNTVRHMLKLLESDGEVTLQVTHLWTQVNIVNYSKYQDFRNQTDTVTDTVTAHNRTKEPCNKVTKEQIKDKKIKDISPRFVRPTLQELSDYAKSISYTDFNPHYFMNYYDGNGWMAGSHKMKDWQATVRNWKIRDEKKKVKIEHNTLEDLPF